MRVETLHWCVVKALHREETRAEFNLLRQGYNTFLPRIRRQVRHARRTEWRSVPLFPGYLFVSLDPAVTPWRPIQSTFGVTGLVRFADRPATLPVGLVERLRALSGPDGIMSAADKDILVGDKVRVSGGVFDDWIGEVIALPDTDRISLLLKAAHRSIEVTVPSSAAYLIPKSAGSRG